MLKKLFDIYTDNYFQDAIDEIEKKWSFDRLRIVREAIMEKVEKEHQAIQVGSIYHIFYNVSMRVLLIRLGDQLTICNRPGLCVWDFAGIQDIWRN